MAGYIALIHKDEGTSYGVSFPDVPGCISAGDTLDEALANAAEALGGHLALIRADREREPEARSLEAIRGDPEFVEDLTGALVKEIAPRPHPPAKHGVGMTPRTAARARTAGTGTLGERFWKIPKREDWAMAKETSKKVASASSKVLKSGSTGKNSKAAAGSALSQKEKGGGKKK